MSSHQPGPDAIKVVAAPAARAKTAHDAEGIVKNKLHAIEKFTAFKRNEAGGAWMRAMLSFIKKHHANVDWAATEQNLDTVLSRIERGEYLMTFDKKPCVDFEPAKVVVLCKGKSAALTGTLRPTPDIAEPFLVDIVDNLWIDQRFLASDFKLMVQRIAVQYSNVHKGATIKIKLEDGKFDVLRKDAKTWLDSVFSRHKKARPVASLLKDPVYLSEGRAKIRWNLIVCGEYVRCGQLPAARRIVEGDNKDGLLTTPPNSAGLVGDFVNSSSHSLGRISRRYASLVGYEGPEAREGGLEYRF